MSLIVIGGVAFFAMARSESRHVQVMVERERAMRQSQQARAQMEAVRSRVLDLDQARPRLDKLTPLVEASAAPATREPIRVANREITIELNQDGKITMDGKPVELEQFQPALRDANKGRESALSVLVKADKQCRFEHVAAVLAVCQELDIPNVRISAL